MNFATAIFSQKLIDDILPSKNVKLLVSFVGLYFVIIIISYALTYLKNIFILRQTKSFNIRLITTFLSKIFSLPISFFNSMRTGEVLARMKETERIQGTIVALIDSTFVEFLTLILSIFFLMYYNVSIGLVALLSIPFLIIISSYFSKRIKFKQKELLVNYAHFEAYAVESISGIKHIKNSVQELFFNRRLVTRYSDAQETSRKLGEITSKYDFLIGVLASVFSVISMLLGAYYVIIGKMEIGELFAIITILSLTITTTISIISVIIQIQESIVSFERLHDIINSDEELAVIDNGTKNIESLEKPHTLELKNVSFNYPGNLLLLKNIDIKVCTGEVITIFGDIGEGKSTMLNLIQRYFSIKYGNIQVNGSEIDEFNLSNWRSSLGIVSQETKIFMGTVADNITMFKPELNDKLIQFCKDFKLNSFLSDRSSLNLFNILNEDGINLSGGQRQLVGFIRALFTGAPILILDEPTSSMDKSNELILLNILHKIKEHKIIILITHKPEIAKKSDRIYVIRKGCIEDTGSHENLIQRDNIYTRSYNSLFE